MKPVYDAANLIDAHLVRHALEDAGIPVYIRGEALMGGVGDLPVHGMLQVCVPDVAWPQADGIVRELGLGAEQASEAGHETSGGAGLAPGWAS